MKTHEYKTIRMESKFRSKGDVPELDRIINESAANGWELVTTSPLATSIWDYGKTNALLLTFRRETGEANR